MKISDRLPDPIKDPEQRGFVEAQKPRTLELPVIYVDKCGCGALSSEHAGSAETPRN